MPGKAELLDAMLDVVLAETARPQDVPGGWRGRLEIVARENLALLRRHPWILEVDIGRPPLGPNMIAKYDYELRAVEGIGLTDLEMDAVVTLVLSHAAGAARTTADADGAREDTGLTSGQWWNRSAPVLRQFLTPDRFPLAVRVGSPWPRPTTARTIPTTPSRSACSACSTGSRASCALIASQSDWQ